MEQTYWYQKQLRILQTVLRASDAVGYQAERVVDYLTETASNCVVVNAGGVMDFFKEEISFGKRNPLITNENILGDLIRECHKRHIRVIGRVDFRGVEEERYKRHPDWFGMNAEGVGQISWRSIYRPCYNSYYATEHAVSFIRMLLEQYDFDGIWENSVGFGIGPCYCKRCKERYYRETGNEIPSGDDYEAEHFREYRVWKAKCADDHLALMRSTVKSYGEEKAYCAEIFGMFHSSNSIQTGIDLYNARKHFDFLVTPAFLDGSADPGKKWDDIASASFAVRFLKAIEPEKQAVILCGNNGTKWRYIKAPSLETKLWMWEIAAQGGGIWNCYFNGQYPSAAEDRRNAYLEKDIYEYLRIHEEILNGQMPVADVGIYYSKWTRDLLGRDREQEDGYGVFIKGAERVFSENHISCQFIPDLDFSFDKIKDLKVLVMPNVVCLSEEHAKIIRTYVEAGGGLVASYKTSLYDTNGNIRTDFALADLFGCSYTGMEVNTESDSYQLVRRRHEILGDMGICDSRMIMNDGSTLLCTKKQDDNWKTICSYIPLIYNQPPEHAWDSSYETDYPTIVAGTYGRGRVVYFANQTDKLCLTNGHEDFVQTYENAVKWAAKGNFSLYTDAPGSVHVHLLKRDKGEYIISFVNTTMGTGRPARCLVPVYGLEARLDDSCGELLEWRLLTKGNVTISAQENSSGICFKIDKLEEFVSVYMKTTGGI